MEPLRPSINESAINSNSSMLTIPLVGCDDPVFKQEFIDETDHKNDQVLNTFIKQELIDETDNKHYRLLMSFMNSDIAYNKNADLWSIGKCIFCKEKIEEDSKILKCLHTICKDCIKRKNTDSGIWCKCKIVTKGELIDYSIMALNQSQVKICCGKNCQLIAKKICMHCKSMYCKPCSKIHSIKNEDHNPDLMMTYPLKKEFVPCPKCMQKSVEVFCTKCSIMLCAICHLNFHQKHEFNLLSTMAVETKAELQTLLNDISKDNNHLNFIRQMSNDNIKKLKSEKKKINDKIDERIKMIHKEADKRGLELKKLLETNFTNAVNNINTNNMVINDFEKENDYYYSLTSSVINWDKIVDCIKLSKIIKDKMVIAKRHTQDMRKEVTTSKAELIYNDEQSVNKIIESIQGMGDIISSKIVSLSEFKITVDSNKVLQTLKNDQSQILRSEPVMIQSGVSKLEKDNYEMMIDEVSDSSDFKPLVNSDCNQWTEELLNSSSSNKSYHNDCHIPSLAKELKPKDVHNINTMNQQQQQQPQQQPSSQPQMNDNQKRSNEQTDKDDCQSNEGFVVKMRGLSWSTTTDDIIKFLSPLGEAKVKDGASGVHFTMTTEGRPSGEAYVEMESKENLKAALKKDGKFMGSRFIDVFRSKRSEMERAIKKTGSTLDSELYDNCVHIRGLPFGFTEDDIVEFFQGLEMIPNGITIATNSTGRSTGAAFIQFINKENAEEALKKHMKKIRQRYIEVFRSSLTEICNQPLQRRPRQTPYDRNDRFASSGGGSGGSRGRGRHFDMSMETERNMKLFGSGRSMGGPRGDGRGSNSGFSGGNSFWDKDIFSA
ncbi:uncharacterized protein LOC132936460 [Metopolophium dirhodum]|uniref:uncharacterized protein LOC132936460 n=1 Tax=Metopolophium dirhodum TaxID=44670 RepID=UPI0029901133|nr:uncharacterized protein LOC132936460 [Metopolophium dirhodum]XP_060859177.1 uncharacterized protein LOC132936460 [Metopolophium dirhodum]XP_060859178.1 uncharacterized protein LOC132936460 [Metopolophium dirhodum]XP_060859179.1 uncharacterized protein LOC132936460 [Metopolophium dirhodum]